MAEIIVYSSLIDFRFEGDVNMSGTGTIPTSSVGNDQVKSNANIVRSKLGQDALAKFAINLTDWRKTTAMGTNLPDTPLQPDLGLVGGTYGTKSPYVGTEDLKAAGATTSKARAVVTLPAEYDDGEDVRIRVHTGMITTISDGTATIDFSAYESDGATGIGSDLVTTAAADINSLTFADKDFVITGTGLVVGDVLDIQATIAVNDTATGTAVIAAFGVSWLLCDIRG